MKSAASSSALPPSVLSRAFTSQSEWPDKEEFLDVVYWFRQILGLILGLIWRFLGLTGAAGLVGFAIVNAGVLYTYWTSVQQIEEEDFGGPWELTKEGFMTSFAGFLVTWIIMYSGLHFN